MAAFKSPDFTRLLGALADSQVRFILVGGLAGEAHGLGRATFDVDVVYARDRENLRRIVAAIAPLGPALRGAPPGLPFLFDEETLERGLNFTLTTAGGDFDLLGEIPGGGGYDDLLPESATLSVFGRDCRVLDLPALIRVKRAAGRPKDFEVLAQLEALLEERHRLGL
jgi:hypothetical protein